MKLHKIEVAQRQLDTAIGLFFADGDPCAVITLAAASEEMLGNYVDGVWIANNPNNMFCRMYGEALRRNLDFKNKSEFSQRLVNVTKNALKHANSPEEQYVLFDEEETVIRLMLALMNYQVGSGRPFSDLMARFELWLRENRAHYIGS